MLQVNAPSSPRHGNDGVRRQSWLWLVGSAGMLGAGLSATVRADAATWLGVRGPHCPLGSCLGPLACPGCGLVRGTSAALQGDLGLAWQCHPSGIAVAGLLVASLLLHFDILRQNRETPVHQRLRHAGRALFAAAVLLGWSLRLLA